MKKVKFDLPEGWIDISQENPDGPSTFLNEKSSSQGVFQISYVEYVKGEIPSPSEKELINLARHAGQSLGE
ncbi:MAG: hypothetical protein KC618_06280, partial [Candidatus Omnitrophica bacterium]|nr:hypothetical protein [Candidatus Omnitrophota bacterium]